MILKKIQRAKFYNAFCRERERDRSPFSCSLLVGRRFFSEIVADYIIFNGVLHNKFTKDVYLTYTKREEGLICFIALKTGLFYDVFFHRYEGKKTLFSAKLSEYI